MTALKLVAHKETINPIIMTAKKKNSAQLLKKNSAILKFPRFTLKIYVIQNP